MTTFANPHTSKLPPAIQEYFPFNPRPGQTLMANEIYYGILSRNNVALEGAAGMGKTITALSALLPICKEENLVLLYAARTHTQMRRVIEEIQAIQRIKGHQISAIALHGRANMCLHEDVKESRPVEAMELCHLLRKEQECQWYENLNSKEIAEATGCFTAEYLREFASEEDLCSYYLSKKLLPHCDIVALTYMYLISPFIRPILFKGIERNIEDCILVFDECHNLPNFTMNMMSISLSDRGLERAISEYKHNNVQGRYPTVYKFLKRFQNYLTSTRAEYGQITDELEIAIDKQGLLDYFKEFIKEESTDLYLLTKDIKNLGWIVKQKRIQAKQKSFSSVAHFGRFVEHLLITFKDPQYLHYFILSKQEHIHYHIRCIDCRRVLSPLQSARGIVSMSGTLDPIDAFIDICGFKPQTVSNVLPSPFDHKNVSVFATRRLDITFYNRTPERYQLFADRCVEAIKGTPGNTAIFCASYEVLEGLLKTTLEESVKNLGRPFYFERRDLTSAENDQMISEFKQSGYQKKMGVLAGVCGGRNSEGVDFPGVEMLTAIVLGVPLARKSHFIDSLIAYYTEQFGIYKGKDYAYTLPAFRRTNQAAGRPIRRLNDYGVIVLMDDRYTWASYRRFLSHWLNENLQTVSGTQERVLYDAISNFYANQEKEKKE